MKKILVFGLSSNIGGIETFYMSYYRMLDLHKYQIDFVINEKHIAFEEEITKKSNVFVLPNPKKHPFAYKRELKKLLLKGNYDIVHVNMLSSANILPLKLAKKIGTNLIIAHSHNSNIPKGYLRTILHYINRKKIPKYANKLLACSAKAGEWLFDGDFTIIKNAIDIDKFAYNEKENKLLRKKHNLSDKNIILGHIGRFSIQKNHLFLLDIMKNIENPNIKLVCIGNGELKDIFKDKIKELNLENRVIVLDGMKDVYKYYSMFNAFLLPSLFEGLPIVGIEAEANGLYSLFSENITNELKINDNVEFVPLKSETWSDKIQKCNFSRTQNIKLRSNGYDIKKEKEILERIYDEEEEGIK